jgi:putative phage-type endonuclease
MTCILYMENKIDIHCLEQDMIRNNMMGTVTAAERTKVVQCYRRKLKKLLKLPVIPQKSLEWYETRYNLITASDFAQALGEGKFGSQKQLIEKKCEPLNTNDTMAASKTNIFFAWGHMFEPLATAVYSHMSGVKVHDFGLIKHPKCAYFGASPDGISELGIMLEIKCPFKRKITGDIPAQYYYQIQGQLDVCDLDECDYLECEFAKFDSYEEYTAAYDELGGNRYTGCFTEDNMGKYTYHDVSLERVAQVGEDGHANVFYWLLKNYNLKRVQRDKKFVKDKLLELGKVWERILVYRQDPGRFAMEVKGKISITTEGLLPQQPQPTLTPSKRSQVGAYALDEKKFLFVDLDD